jgi:hypothetical protein
MPCCYLVRGLVRKIVAPIAYSLEYDTDCVGRAPSAL